METVKSSIAAAGRKTFPFAFEVIAENNWRDTETATGESESAAAGKVREAHPDALLIRRVRD